MRETNTPAFTKIIGKGGARCRICQDHIGKGQTAICVDWQYASVPGTTYAFVCVPCFIENSIKEGFKPDILIKSVKKYMKDLMVRKMTEHGDEEDLP